MLRGNYGNGREFPREVFDDACGLDAHTGQLLYKPNDVARGVAVSIKRMGRGWTQMDAKTQTAVPVVGLPSLYDVSIHWREVPWIKRET
jgi:hypothetical protein